VTFRWTTVLAEAARPLFPPLDRALIQALACEVVAETEQPLSRQSLADLTNRARRTLDKRISRSTVWRVLHEAAIKPWQYDHWIFPRDPAFAKKATPLLDLYAGRWEDQALGPKDFVLSSDEKTSIQARRRCHTETPPISRRRRRIEPEYKRMGALQYLAAWDVGRGMVLGRCEAKTGIEPFGRLVDQILDLKPYSEAERLFLIVDHTPIHASLLNQVEIYFSILQRKVLTPNDFADLDALRIRIRLYEELTNRRPKPFAWKFTRHELADWLKRASPHFPAAKAG
jgi:hypothetical protein